MKNLYIDIVDRIVKETEYDWDDVASKFDQALAHGTKPIDFFDNIVDDYCMSEIY